MLTNTVAAASQNALQDIWEQFMNRREVAALLAALALGGCGGGGGGGGATGSAASGFGANALALWGDSHTLGLPNNSQVPGVAELVRSFASGRSVFAGGYAGLTSTQIADQQVADDAHDDWTTVFWYGGNNEDQPGQIKADLARSIASLAPGNNRFLVLPVLNQASPWERRGSAGYATIMQLNADLAALYPGNFLDVRGELVRRYDPSSPQDVADFQDDVPPTSLRADGVHLNERGYAIVAQLVLQFLVQRGW